MTGVVALFVDPDGVYRKLLGRSRCWAEIDDARLYEGPHPVVAHPPCNLWVNMAAANYARGLREGKPRPMPAWYPGGTDAGCFSAALKAVQQHGGVLEHPAGSWAWSTHALLRPGNPDYLQGYGSGWYSIDGRHWTCEVWQSAYGHKARKRTWLLYVGKRPPFELNWERKPGTHQCGWFDRNKPTLSKREASATPEAFARELIRLARWSRRP